MKNILGACFLVATFVAVSAMADGGSMSLLPISSGSIRAGKLGGGKIASDPPDGAKYKKGDQLTGGDIKEGKVSAARLKPSQTYSIAAGRVASVTGGELSRAKIGGAKISAASLNGETLDGDITVDLSDAEIKSATIDSPDVSIQELQAAAQATKGGSIQNGKYAPPVDLSGRRITLRQDDAQYGGFRLLAPDRTANPTRYYCGDGCRYMVKQDDGQSLVVNVSKIGDPTQLDTQLDDPPTHLKAKDQDYLISKDLHQQLNYDYRGFTFGVLLIPYKWQVSDHSISGAATLGPYLGYQTGTSLGNYGVNMIPLLSVGITNVSVQNPNSSTPSNATALSVAYGVAFSLTKSQSSLQGGLVCGQDRAGSSTPTPYKYEAKNWCAVELGFAFTQ